MEALTACHTMEFKLHPMGREANEVLREGLLRQTGTWDPLLQCFHLDIYLLEQPNAKKLQGTKNNYVHS